MLKEKLKTVIMESYFHLARLFFYVILVTSLDFLFFLFQYHFFLTPHGSGGRRGQMCKYPSFPDWYTAALAKYGD
jgi:hypothetical protein